MRPWPPQPAEFANEIPDRAPSVALILIAGDVCRDVAFEVGGSVPVGARRVAGPPFPPVRIGRADVDNLLTVPTTAEGQVRVEGAKVASDLYKSGFRGFEQIACCSGPAHRDAGASLYIRRHNLGRMDPWFAPHPVGLEDDPVSLSTRFDHGLAARAVERLGHRDDRLQRIPLLAARRRDVSFAAGRADIVVEHARNGFGGEARTIVGDDDFAGVGRDINVDVGRDPGFLGGVECVVSKFFQTDEWPLRGRMPDLLGEFVDAAELGEPRCPEEDPLQSWIGAPIDWRGAEPACLCARRGRAMSPSVAVAAATVFEGRRFWAGAASFT